MVGMDIWMNGRCRCFAACVEDVYYCCVLMNLYFVLTLYLCVTSSDDAT